MTIKSELRKKDKEWADAVRKRDKFTCQMCHKVPKPAGCHAHHIIPRQFKETRHDIQNGLTLCFVCHKVGKFSAHLNAVYFTQWLLTFQPYTYNYVLTQLNNLIKDKETTKNKPKDKRGSTSGILIVDECAYIEEDLFFKILEPTTNKGRGAVIMTSTPNSMSG